MTSTELVIHAAEMLRASVARWLLVGPILAVVAGSAWSQVAYLCSVDGRSYYSVQPCPTSPAAVRPVAPPVREARPAGATAGATTPDKPGEQRPYQTALCADLGEATRTGALRGLGPSGEQELREAYRRLCSDDESRAREPPKDEKARQREQEAKAAKLEQDREKLTREQCAEMLRIAQGKRQRLEAMTAGERGDFERFDATRKARCGG